jgi:hypothetical protein
MSKPPRPLGQPKLIPKPFPMILHLRARSLRERDAWGQSAPLRRRGTEPEGWPRGSTGTVFRFDRHGPTAGGRCCCQG